MLVNDFLSLFGKHLDINEKTQHRMFDGENTGSFKVNIHSDWTYSRKVRALLFHLSVRSVIN